MQLTDHFNPHWITQNINFIGFQNREVLNTLP